MKQKILWFTSVKLDNRQNNHQRVTEKEQIQDYRIYIKKLKITKLLGTKIKNMDLKQCAYHKVRLEKFN